VFLQRGMVENTVPRKSQQRHETIRKCVALNHTRLVAVNPYAPNERIIWYAAGRSRRTLQNQTEMQAAEGRKAA